MSGKTPAARGIPLVLSSSKGKWNAFFNGLLASFCREITFGPYFQGFRSPMRVAIT
jgi:hypothetical protein